MSTNNRVGRNPFDKKPKSTSQAIHASETAQAELDLKVSQAAPSESILKISDRKTKAEEQIIGELIDLPEENWQPLSMVPTQFIKQLFLRWL